MNSFDNLPDTIIYTNLKLNIFEFNLMKFKASSTELKALILFLYESK